MYDHSAFEIHTNALEKSSLNFKMHATGADTGLEISGR